MAGFRDDYGAWLSGFGRNLGSCSVLMLELWRIYLAFELACDKGYQKLSLESDSIVAVSLITN